MHSTQVGKQIAGQSYLCWIDAEGEATSASQAAKDKDIRYGVSAVPAVLDNALCQELTATQALKFRRRSCRHEYPQRINSQRGEERGMKESENSEDDRRNSRPAFAVHQSPADENSACGNNQKQRSQRKQHGWYESARKHLVADHDMRRATKEHEHTRGDHPEHADDDPQSAKNAKMALKATASRHNRSVGAHWICALWAHIEVSLKLSTTTIAEHSGLLCKRYAAWHDKVPIQRKESAGGRLYSGGARGLR
jgi:hypothetical protein